MDLRLRSDLLYGAHPEDPERVLVFSPRTEQRAEVPIAEWLDAEALARHGFLEARRGDEGGPGRVRGSAVLPRVEAQWRVVDRASLPATELAVHPQARFWCGGEGACCESGLLVRLTAGETARARDAARALFGAGAKDPVFATPTGRGTRASFALDLRESCVFLDEARRCRVHGSGAQPKTCAVFPMRFVAFRARVHVSVSHRCLCATYDRGPCLEERMAELRARFDRIQDVHVLPEVTRLDATETCATEDVLAAIAGGGELPVERASGRELDRLAGALAALRDEEELVPGSPIARLLGRTAARPSRSTPAQAQAQASVTAADTAAADTAAAAAADRFARDFIFGLQLYRFPTLADGLLALDLARSQIETTEDIMLWESALASNAFPAWFAGAQRGL